MKVNNFIKKWWKKQKKHEQVALIVFAISLIVQIFISFIIPCFVSKLEYTGNYIFAMCVVLIISGFIIYLATSCFFEYLFKHSKSKLKILIILISLAITILVVNTKLPFNSLVGSISIPTRQDYLQLVEIAEKVDEKADLYKYADDFSWYKESDLHCATFSNEAGCLDVKYNSNFEIIHKEWMDFTNSTLMEIYLWISLNLIISVILSAAIFWIIKYVKEQI